MDERLVPPRPLAAITLSGPRAGLHGALRWLLSALAVGDLFVYQVSMHAACGTWKESECGDRHPLADDPGGALYVAIALVVLLQLAGWRRRLGMRVLTAGVSACAMFTLLLTTSLAHLFATADGDESAQGLAGAILALMLIQLVVEVVVTVRERRRLEADDPTLPAATIVSR
jgi:hypothetical protein